MESNSSDCEGGEEEGEGHEGREGEEGVRQDRGSTIMEAKMPFVYTESIANHQDREITREYCDIITGSHDDVSREDCDVMTRSHDSEDKENEAGNTQTELNGHLLKVMSESQSEILMSKNRTNVPS